MNSTAAARIRTVGSLLASLFILTAPAGNAEAVYNANMSGQIDGFWAYAEGDYILFRLKNQPASHPACNPSFFAIPDTVPADRRKMLFARLSLAYATQESVNIGYDNLGDCAIGYIRVHRVG